MAENDTDERGQAINKAVEALTILEKELGASPSVAEIAERINLSIGAVHSYLREAAARGTIVQRRGKFMSLEIAKAFDNKKGGK